MNSSAQDDADDANNDYSDLNDGEDGNSDEDLDTKGSGGSAVKKGHHSHLRQRQHGQGDDASDEHGGNGDDDYGFAASRGLWERQQRGAPQVQPNRARPSGISSGRSGGGGGSISSNEHSSSSSSDGVSASSNGVGINGLSNSSFNSHSSRHAAIHGASSAMRASSAVASVSVDDPIAYAANVSQRCEEVVRRSTLFVPKCFNQRPSVLRPVLITGAGGCGTHTAATLLQRVGVHVGRLTFRDTALCGGWGLVPETALLCANFNLGFAHSSLEFTCLLYLNLIALLCPPSRSLAGHSLTLSPTHCR